MNDPPQPVKARTVPQSELDYAMMTANPVWGKTEVLSPELKNAMTFKYGIKDSKTGEQFRDSGGNPIVTEQCMWDLLEIFTRDLRFGNLNRKEGDVIYCEYYLNLGGDLLKEGMVASFIACMNRVAARMELTQSVNGFLREIMNTFIQKSISTPLEPEKGRSLLGLGGKK
jgi:hypothetical protein